MEQVLRDIIEGVSNNYGRTFFDTITLKMHQAIGADYTFIARLDVDAYMSRTISLVAGGDVVDNMEYSLQHTPCANVADDSVCLYPKDIISQFPKDQLLIDMGIEGYIGTPLHDSNGEVMGLTVALYKAPIKDPIWVETLFQIFSGRIAAEIERMEYAESLEEMVKQRTLHLEETLKTLKRTQNQLVHQEKLASLGGVVAGVAHEVNTPLGIAKTAASYQKDLLNKTLSEYEQKTLTASAMQQFLIQSQEASESIELNLERAVDLINNFKLAAVDRIDSSVREHNVSDFLQHLMTPLNAELARNKIELILDVPESISISTYGSDLSQVLNNLIMNACMHGFGGIEKPVLHIKAQETEDLISIYIADNGVGIDESIRDTIYEPFVTTKRHQGSTGLGMNIVHNLVTAKLGGQIDLLPTQHGTTWQITLPKVLFDQPIFSQKSNQR